jgi:hypothetical protein
MSPTGITGNSRAAPGRGGFGWGWDLDVLMALLILAVLNALAAAAWLPATFKAKSSEQVLASMTWRTHLVEHYAVTGDWNVTDGVVPRDFANAVPAAIKWQSRHAATGVVDGVIVTLGRYPGQHDGLAIIAFRPAVPKASEQPTVRWLCGHVPTPPGWHGPRIVPAANLADELLLSQCRKRMNG